MKKCIFLIAILFLAATASRLYAQSIRNTDWKTFIGDPLNDSFTLHIIKDSSFVTNSMGNIMVRSVCIIPGDTLTLKDYDGEYACTSIDGRYKIRLEEGQLILALIDDPCDRRVKSIDGVKWRKSLK
jgi:hypothetical protein